MARDNLAMLNDKPPVDTIELLLREIAERLRRKADETSRGVSAVLVALCIAGCASSPTDRLPDAPSTSNAPVAADDVKSERVAGVFTCATSDQCPSSMPICDVDAGRCMPCDGAHDSGSAHACGEALPLCSASGACVECLDASTCASAQQTCANNQCAACTVDSDCTSGRCHDDGTCAWMGSVVYVDHDHACRDEAHASSPSDPYCEIAPSLAVAGETVVHLAPSSHPYLGVNLSGHTPQEVSIMGPGAAHATIYAGDENNGVTLTAQDGNTVTLFITGVTITSSGFAYDAECSGKSDHAWMTLEDVVLRDGASFGLIGNGCHLAMRRSIVQHNAYGVVLSYSTYDISRTFVVGNTSDGMRISYSTGTLDAMTIVGNTYSDGAAGLDCDNGPCTISRSIIVGNQSTAMGDAAQVSANVVVTNCVLGAGSTRGIACTPVFVSTDDAHLEMTGPAATQNQSCVFGHGGSTDSDVDGGSRRRRPGARGRPTHLNPQNLVEKRVSLER